TFNEDSLLIFSAGNGNRISVSDVDDGDDGVNGNETMQVSLSVDSGTLSLSGVTGLTFTVGNGTANTAMTFRGTINSLNAALSGMTYTPVGNFVGGVTLTMTTNDLGNFGTGGPLTAANTLLLNVTPVNDAPTNSVPGAQSVNEDTNLVFSAGN